MRMRTEIPSRIANAPELGMGLQLYMSAWMDLDSCRPSGLSEGSIPWTAIQKYSEVYNFTEEQAEAAHYHIKYLDSVFFKFRAEKRGN